MSVSREYTIIVEPAGDEFPHHGEPPFTEGGRNHFRNTAYDFLEELSRSGYRLTLDEKMEYAGIECALSGGRIRTDRLHQLNIAEEEVRSNPLFWIAYYETKESVQPLTGKEKVKLEINKKKESIRRLKLLNGKIASSGLTFPLSPENVEKIAVIQNELRTFKTIRFEVLPMIYCDVETYVHIAIRHVSESIQVGATVSKAAMPLQRGELKHLLQNVFVTIVDEMKAHFENNKNQKFYRNDLHTVGFNGDHYSIDVDTDGRILAFSNCE